MLNSESCIAYRNTFSFVAAERIQMKLGTSSARIHLGKYLGATLLLSL
jgi:hypothetical protein